MKVYACFITDESMLGCQSVLVKIVSTKAQALNWVWGSTDNNTRSYIGVELEEDPKHEEIVASANDISFVQEALYKPEIQEILNQEDNVGGCPTCGSDLYYCGACGATGLNWDEYKNHFHFCSGEDI